MTNLDTDLRFPDIGEPGDFDLSVGEGYLAAIEEELRKDYLRDLRSVRRNLFYGDQVQVIRCPVCFHYRINALSGTHARNLTNCSRPQAVRFIANILAEKREAAKRIAEAASK